MSGRVKSAAWVLAGAAATSAAVLALNGTAQPPSESSGPTALGSLLRGGVTVLDGGALPRETELTSPGKPCVSATAVAVNSLGSGSVGTSEAQVVLPDKAVAAADQAWICDEGGDPVVMFQDVQVTYQPGWSDVDTKSKWAEYAAERGGTVMEFGTYSAYVQQGSEKDATNSMVMFVVGDTAVQIVALQSVRLDQLTGIAKSMIEQTRKASRG